MRLYSIFRDCAQPELRTRHNRRILQPSTLNTDGLLPFYGLVPGKTSGDYWNCRHHRLASLCWLLPSLTLLILAGCGGATGGSTASPNHSLLVTPQPAKALTFYEGTEDIEPFTPFAAVYSANGGWSASNGSGNQTSSIPSYLTFGFAPIEGASYVTGYDAQTWQETIISNGFLPNDPLWDCDAAPEQGTFIAADGSMVARACSDGSITFFSLPNALVLHQVKGDPTALQLGAREPAVTFSPHGSGATGAPPNAAMDQPAELIAYTDDGPAGPGTHITIANVAMNIGPSGSPQETWTTLGVIPVTAGLLSRPSWSPDGSLLAAVDLNGVLHIWDMSSGTGTTGFQEVGSVQTPHFVLGQSTSDPATPSPQWSPDGTTIVVATPATATSSDLGSPSSTVLSFWKIAAGSLRQLAFTSIAQTPVVVDPRISPDGTLLLVHTAETHAQIFALKSSNGQPGALRQVGDFAVPGPLVLWGADAQHITAFTSQATEVQYVLSNP